MITKQVKEQHGAVICLDPKSVDSGSLWQAQLLSDRIIENALKYMKTDSTIFFSFDMTRLALAPKKLQGQSNAC